MTSLNDTEKCICNKYPLNYQQSDTLAEKGMITPLLIPKSSQETSKLLTQPKINFGNKAIDVGSILILNHNKDSIVINDTSQKKCMRTFKKLIADKMCWIITILVMISVIIIGLILTFALIFL